jgi:tetratricopeptide (TPR) repeat protein
MSRLSFQQALQLGVQHHSAGRLAEAEAVYRQILAAIPNQPDALHLLGVIAHQAGQHTAAIEIINRAIESGSRQSGTYNNLGEAYRALGRDAEAAQCYEQALQLEPDFAGAHSNLGIILHRQKRFDEALSHYRRAIELEPASPEAYNNLGNLLIDQQRIPEAIESYRTAIRLRESYAEAHNNLAAALEKLEDFDAASAEYDRALALHPRFVEAMNNLGTLRQKQGRHEKALAMWQRACATNPQFGEAQWNIGLHQLAAGDYARGWEGYEWRWRCDHSRGRWREYAGKPRWDGAPLAGRTILLYPEQGFGDVIQFARFVPAVAARGGRVVLECQPELVQVMRTLDGVAGVVATGETLPSFDTYLALLSVPRVIGTTLQTLPNQVPYLHADPTAVPTWRERIQASPGMLKVGLTWGGNITPDPKRSMSLADLAPLAEIAGVAWFSLQKGEPAQQLASPPRGMRIVDLGSELTNFADTAAAIANLELLITIDTAVAHLAGAMGVKTWTLLPFAPDWRWMLERDDSPWYPTMRLFRQPAWNDWASVVARVVDGLRRLVS